MNKKRFFLLVNFLLLLFLANCSAKSNSSTITAESAPPATDSAELSASQSTPAPEFSTLTALSICYSAPLPTSFINELGDNPELSNCNDEDVSAQIVVSDQNPVSHWIYALAAPFFTIDDDMTAEMLKLSGWTAIKAG